jgi:hypothetical protein
MDSPPATHWKVDDKHVLGWRSGDDYFCRECAQARGVADLPPDGAGADRGPIVQEDLPLPHVFRLVDCSGGCRRSLPRPQ